MTWYEKELRTFIRIDVGTNNPFKYNERNRIEGNKDVEDLLQQYYYGIQEKERGEWGKVLALQKW